MWQEHWRERGFNSWSEWWKNYAAPLKPESLKWYLFEITNPLREFPLIYGTPTRGWIAKCYDGKITKKLKDTLEHPVVADNEKVKSIVKNFPKETMFTGVVHNGRIVLVEGMHRACALAIMARDGKELKSKVKIALAEFSREIPAIEKGNNRN